MKRTLSLVVALLRLAASGTTALGQERPEDATESEIRVVPFSDELEVLPEGGVPEDLDPALAIKEGWYSEPKPESGVANETEAILAAREVEWAPKDLSGVAEHLAADRVGLLERQIVVAPTGDMDRVTREAVLVQLPTEITGEPLVTDDGRAFTRSGVEVTASVSYLTETYRIDARAAVEQLERQLVLTALGSWIDAELRPKADFGGAWIDHADGGRIVIASTSAEDLAATAKALGDSPIIETRRVAHSVRELESAQKLAEQRLRTAGLDSDIAAAWTDLKANAIRVDVAQGASLSTGAIGSRLADLGPPTIVNQVERASLADEPAACPEDNCSFVKGGVRLRQPNDTSCSAGFTLRHTVVAGGVPQTPETGWITSAGHCDAAFGETLRHGDLATGPIVGDVQWTRESGNVDAQLINRSGRSIATQQGRIWRPSDASWRIWGQLTRAESSVGSVYCQAGYRDSGPSLWGYEDCGEMNSKTVGGSSGGISGIGRLDNTGGCSGDSGGPIFEEGSHSAIGLLTSIAAGSDCNAAVHINFTFLSDAMAAYEAVTGHDIELEVWDPPLLRVTTNPPVASQIRLDGIPRDSWSLDWMKIDDTNGQTVSFGDVAGYTTPNAVTINPTHGQTTPVTGAFEQRGWLRVITNPSTIGANISIDGLRRDRYGLWTDLPPGAYQVCFSAVVNWLPPPCDDVTITAGNTEIVNANYTNCVPLGLLCGGLTNVGLLRVTTQPELPSQISVRHPGQTEFVPMDSYGLEWVAVPPGTYTIRWSDVPGYTTPNDVTVNVVAGNTYPIAGDFSERGWLRVITSPATPATIYVGNGTTLYPRNDWGMWTHLPPGFYRVCFGSLAVTTPNCEDPVLVNAGQTTTITGVFPI